MKKSFCIIIVVIFLSVMIEEKEVPEYLYKYRNFDEFKYYEGIFKKNILFFSSPRHFNDPFDCKIFPNYEIGTNDEIFQKILSHTQDMNPSLSKPQVKKIAKKDFNNNIKILRSPEKLAERGTELVNNRTGVCSLTEKRANLLMWAHYTNCHKGFCLEFDARKLYQICKNYIRINELILLLKVNYERMFPIVNPYNDKYDSNNFLKLFKIKSSDWEYEQEWRLIYDEHPDETLEFPDEVLKSIYFGVNCTNERIDECLELMRDRKTIPKLYKAKRMTKEFGITFTEL